MVTVTHKGSAGRVGLDASLGDLEGQAGQVGWFSSSKYPNGTSVAYVAAIQEFGYGPKNIPPRMGLRGLIVAKKEEWSRVAQYGAKQMLNGAATAYDMLTLIGAKAEGDIRKQISDVTEPPLAEATIEARRRRSASGEARTATGSKPLVDTGYMLATVTHMVTGKGETA